MDRPVEVEPVQPDGGAQPGAGQPIVPAFMESMAYLLRRASSARKRWAMPIV
jgi:hypothetical protein